MRGVKTLLSRLLSRTIPVDEPGPIAPLLIARNEIADLRAEKQRLVVTNRQLEADKYALQLEVSRLRGKRGADGRFVRRGS